MKKLLEKWTVRPDIYFPAGCRLNQGWEFAHRFSERIARFLQKNERMSDSLKKTSDLLTSLIKKEGMSELVVFLNLQKTYLKAKNTILVQKLWANRSFLWVKEQMSDSLMAALLTWATWAIRSLLLICPERSERIAHSCSFDLSDLSKWEMSEWANSNPACTELCA